MTETKTASAAPKAPRAKTAKAADATVSAFPNFEAFTMPKMEIPAVTREMAEKSIEQAREAYAKLKTAAEDATDLIEDGFETTRRSVLDFNHKAVDAARANTDATFQFVKDLFEVKTLAEVIELQTSFARAQFDAFGAQAKDMQELSTKLAGEMNDTFKGAVEKASKDFKAA
ncbi:phasin [Stappia sp. 28M-7]|jgi:phasin|uniref:phasin n=1 Tax=Stappia sp. 28M-7 TaxID=2762596 RepID=UPI000E757B5E|nr:phasin [Stappia sp. 28M-7]MBC2858114.1 phasin [Stappia sp. 28M-7]